jgi:spermidine synthase
VSRTPASLRALALVFALSGCAGLMHEVAWARALGQSLGNSLGALTAVLAAFLGGLGLGSLMAARAAGRSRDPLLVYAVLEGLLAICGALAPVVVWTLPRVLAFAGPACGSDRLLALLRFALAVAALLPSTLLMGATLPWVVREAASRGAPAGFALASLYGANTLGAAVGAIVGSFASLPFLGTRATFLAAGSINALAAAAALVLRRQQGEAPAALAPGARPRPAAPADSESAVVAGRFILPLAAALSGAIGAILQIGWTRVAALAFGSTVYALGTTLAAYIFGLGTGPLLLRRRLARGGSPWLAALALAAAGLFSLLLVPVLGRLPIVAAIFSGWIETTPAALLVLQFVVVAALLALPTMAQGTVFPALTALATSDPAEAHRPAGRLYAASTWGSVLGVLIAGFAALPLLGTRRCLVLASAASMGIAVLPLSLLPFRKRSAALGGLSLVILALGLPWLLPGWDPDLMSGGGFLYGPVYRSASGGQGHVRELMHRRGEILFSREDGVGLVTVRRSPAGIQSLQINGKTEASTGGDMTTQLLSAHLPLLLHPGSKNALVIGLASGITLGAAERHPLQSIEVIEIAPVVIEAARLFDPWNGRSLDDERARVVVDDARGRLLARPDRYDVITSQPSNPWVAGVSNLFTVEFYRLVRARLNPGGLFCQWVQAYRLSPEDFRGIVASFLQVFPDATLWEESAGGGDYFLLGGDAPLRPEPARLQREDRREAWSDLRRGGLDGAADLLARFVSGPDGLRLLARGARPHTDDDLYLETHAPLTMFRDTLREQIAILRRIRQPVFSILPEGIAARDPELAAQLRSRARQRDLRLEIASGLKDADLWGLGDPYLAAGIAALRGGLLAEAVAALSHAAASNPESGTAHYLLGEAYRATGLADAAAVAYAEAVRRDPDLAPAWNALGRSLLQRGEIDRASAAFLRALTIDSGLAEARNNLGALHLKTGHLDEAETMFRRALQDNPGLAAAQANLGLLFKRRGDRSAAEAAYRAALEIDPLNADARYNLAVLLKDGGRLEAARRELKDLLAGDPGDTEAAELLRTIERPRGTDAGASRVR